MQEKEVQDPAAHPRDELTFLDQRARTVQASHLFRFKQPLFTITLKSRQGVVITDFGRKNEDYLF